MGFFKTINTLAYLALCSSAAAASVNGSAPITYGIILYRMFDVMDVFGPLEVLQFLRPSNRLDIFFIAETMESVTTRPQLDAMNPHKNEMFSLHPPTHTFETAPELDVLIIPGGPGWRNPAWNASLEYIKRTAPKVKQVITICTGAGLAARAGIMAGRKATTNKSSWKEVVSAPESANTTWVTSARWVEDYSSEPPVWSSSGVTSGIDLMLHWVEQIYNKENATNIARNMEHVRISDPSYDPFARPQYGAV
ncbi:class I glutamine amidotransferase-like protein [Phaeosphaeriaceae sp. SRC1lsM3a]|nr:class I glutamine amidotransferase-like protein [Stagonospora sp. SRC1lsM3a]